MTGGGRLIEVERGRERGMDERQMQGGTEWSEGVREHGIDRQREGH